MSRQGPMDFASRARYGASRRVSYSLLVTRNSPLLMLWLFTAWFRLKKLGILGMNRRNAAYILDHNPRALYPRVDNKLPMQHLCARIGVPTPAVYGEIFYHSML